jgi:hypothetical protein
VDDQNAARWGNKKESLGLEKWRAQQELNLQKNQCPLGQNEYAVTKSVTNARHAAILSEVIAAWPKLAEPLKAAILALVRSATQHDG